MRKPGIMQRGKLRRMKKGDTSHGTGGRRPECNELGWLWKEMKEPRANKTTEEENLDK